MLLPVHCGNNTVQVTEAHTRLTWVLLHHHIPLLLRIFLQQLNLDVVRKLFPALLFVYSPPVRYQCPGPQAAEEPLQSDLHPHREDRGPEPEAVEEQKRDGPLRDQTGRRDMCRA